MITVSYNPKDIYISISIQLTMFPELPYSHVPELYSSPNTPRYHQLLDQFELLYKKKAQFIARAPGRVNIIGEHIDYQGYGVLPAAIEKDCLIAVAVNNEPTISIAHVDSRYPSQIIPRDPNLPCQFKNNYAKYIRAGYRAGVKDIDAKQLKGMEIMVAGNVPIAAGLSSSSSLCVCSAVATRHANRSHAPPISRQHFIQTIIEGERETGTASGGMDQSISVLGRPNCCLFIQFNPIRCLPVPLPPACTLIIMNSLVESPKLQTAVFRYNKRVCECRIAVELIARKIGGKGKILKDVEEWTGLSVENLGRVVKGMIVRKDYQREELEEMLGKKLEEILRDIPLHKEVIAANKTFKIHQAAVHVFGEAHRVVQFTKICNSHLPQADKMMLLGQLMNQSQDSCRDLYDCSCAQLDEITSLALKKGAIGSRLTGAGWGGCTVSMVEESKANDFMQAMIDDYYMKRPELKDKIVELGIENVVFQSKPSQGACVITI